MQGGDNVIKMKFLEKILVSSGFSFFFFPLTESFLTSFFFVKIYLEVLEFVNGKG
jgi:hypothetical protein